MKTNTILKAVLILAICTFCISGTLLYTMIFKPFAPTYPYHLKVNECSYQVYDENDKLIGNMDYGKNPELDSVIDNDNQ